MLLHADADAFFASVEQRDDPRYRGRPMVVAEQVVGCASYEARALGIRAGMPLGRVIRRWPDVLVAPFRVEVYEQASADLFVLFRQFSPLVEPGSMEEAFLDVTGRGDAMTLAHDLRRRARAELGLPVSVGAGRTKLMAKLASRRAKPDGVLVIDAEFERVLRPTLSLADLWGVGPPTAEKLRAAGLTTVADLAGFDEAALTRLVSTAMARRLLAVVHGTEDATIRLPRPRRSVSAQRSVSPPTRTRSAVVAVLHRVVRVALDRLGDDARVPRAVEVHVRFDDGAVVNVRRRLPDASADPVVVLAAAEGLLERTAFEADGRGVSLVGVSLPLTVRPPPSGQLLLPVDDPPG